MRLIAAGGRSNDACLHARQFLEHALGAGSGEPFTVADYRLAANLLHGQGSLALGDVLESIADTDAELRAATPSWTSRYARRPPTEEERRAEAQIRAREIVESGQAEHGVDGAWYTRAYYPRSGTPAVVVTTSALTEIVATFANKAEAQAWLDSRAPAGVRPASHDCDRAGHPDRAGRGTARVPDPRARCRRWRRRAGRKRDLDDAPARGAVRRLAVADCRGRRPPATA